MLLRKEIFYLCILGNFASVFFFLFSAVFFYFKINLSENSFRNATSVTNSFDPDQARRFVGPDLGPNCLQRLSADITKIIFYHYY